VILDVNPGCWGRYDSGMAMVFHISEEEAARDFAAVMRRVREGAEVVVEEHGTPVLVMRPVEVRAAPSIEVDPAAQVRGKAAEEIIEALDRWEAKHGKLNVDEDFGADIQAAHDLYNQPSGQSKWD